MRQKAASRNPDEFYFGMHNSEVKDGKHRASSEDDRNLTPDMVKLLKEQDLSYVRMQKQRDAKKAERLQSSLHFLDTESDAVKKRKHVIFVENQKEAEDFEVSKHFDTLPEMAGRAFNRPKLEQIEKLALKRMSGGIDDDEGGTSRSIPDLKALAKVERKLARQVAKARSTAYKELEARTKRAAELELAEAHLVTEKLVAGKGRKRKIKPAEDGKPAQYKWRRKRMD